MPFCIAVDSRSKTTSFHCSFTRIPGRCFEMAVVFLTRSHKTCAHIHVNVYIYIYMCVYIYIYTYIQTHTHARAHAHTHTHTLFHFQGEESESDAIVLACTNKTWGGGAEMYRHSMHSRDRGGNYHQQSEKLSHPPNMKAHETA